MVGEKLKRAWLWLTRISRSRGFGVQSPNDYRFIRYVINEHWPYYQYEDLRQSFPDVDRVTRDLCQLYLRMANDCQPAQFIELTEDHPAFAAYVKAGCRATETKKGYYSENDEEQKVVIVKMKADQSELLPQMMAHAAERSIIVMHGIYESKEARDAWEKAVLQERVGVAYDLYDCGLLLCVRRKYKKCYKINF